jgi:beta-lactamase class D
MERERDYLEKYHYGNQDPSSGLTSFWLGQSLQISPEEQLEFWRRLYSGDLPASGTSVAVLKQMLVQPRGVVVDARGPHTFAAPWPEDAVISAKTGSTRDVSGQSIRWLVGHVERDDGEYVFVSTVTGTANLAADAAIDLAAAALRQEGVL